MPKNILSASQFLVTFIFQHLSSSLLDHFHTRFTPNMLFAPPAGHARSVLSFLEASCAAGDKSLTMLQLTDKWRSSSKGEGGTDLINATKDEIILSSEELSAVVT